MIRLEGVSFTHAGAGSPALEDIELRVDPGEVVAVTGPSGSGKTTLTRIVNGLVPHAHGGVLSGGIEVGGGRPDRDPLFETARRVGSVFQNPRTQFFATEVLGELAFGAENAGIAPARIAREVHEALERFRLAHLADRSVFALSGGQKQLLACASVDVLRPPVLVLDEPTANLDDGAVQRIAEVVAEWKREGRAVLVAEHRIGWLLGIVDRILVMDSGRIVAALSPEEFGALTATERRRWGLRDPSASAVADLPVGPLGHRPSELAPTPDGSRTDAMTTIRDLRIRHRGARGPALRLDRAELPGGHITAITGPNGSGKSTLARFLVGLHGSGRVERDGIRLSARRRRATSALVMQDVGHQLFAESAQEEVELAQRRADPGEALRILDSLDLSDCAEHHPLSLSAGQQQRLATATAIAGSRSVIVLDEPTSGLDRRRMEQVAALLLRLRAQGTEIFVTTHDREFIELAATWRVHLDRDHLISRADSHNLMP